MAKPLKFNKLRFFGKVKGPYHSRGLAVDQEAHPRDNEGDFDDRHEQLLWKTLENPLPDKRAKNHTGS